MSTTDQTYQEAEC